MRRFETVNIGYELTACVSLASVPVPVVHINALGTDQHQWDQVVTRLPGHTTVTYDRPGIGRSAPLPAHLASTPRTLGALADELSTLLDALAITSPHVVVGHSIGGLIAMMYAVRHPRQTAGLVLVDATTLHDLAHTRWPEPEGGHENPRSSILDVPGSIAELDNAVWPPAPMVVLASAPGRWMRLTAAEAAQYAPLTVTQLDHRWQAGQRLLAQKLNALLVIADWAGHHIATEQPELVATCITAVTTAARDERPVTMSPTELRAAGGSCPDNRSH